MLSGKERLLQSNKESGPPVIEVRRKPKRVPARLFNVCRRTNCWKSPNSQKRNGPNPSVLPLPLFRHRNKLWGPTLKISALFPEFQLPPKPGMGTPEPRTTGKFGASASNNCSQIRIGYGRLVWEFFFVVVDSRQVLYICRY